MRPSLVLNGIRVTALCYALFLGYMCLVPVHFMDGMPRDSDKVMHGAAYVVFGVLWFAYFYFAGTTQITIVKGLFLTIIVGLVYGTVIEILQSYLTTYRSGDYRDVIANGAGLFIAALLIYIGRGRLRRIKSKL